MSLTARREFNSMKKTSGFTFIEVLVAVLILALGLIGLAALQATGVKNIQTAYNRSQAIHMAQDIADRMRANPLAAATYADVNENNAPDYGESTIPPGTQTAGACSSGSCTAAALAKADIGQWRSALLRSLPKGCGVVIRGTGGPGATPNHGCGGVVPSSAISASNRTYTIIINWDENNNGQTDSGDPNFLMSFEL